jgi:predicted amidohydrolase
MRMQLDPRQKRPLRVASVQAEAVSGEIERNVETARRLIVEAAASSAAAIVFPELFLCGYDLALLRREPGRCDLEADDARLDPIRTACRTGAITAILSGSVLTGDRPSRTISALVIDEHGGLLARYDKQYLWRDEQRLFQRGAHACIVEVRGWRLGLGICYDATFPEHARAVALAGADAYLCPSAFREPTILHPVRAFENTVYVAFSNLVGEADGRRFCGRSAIYDPEGDVVADAGSSREGLAIADFDAAVLANVRESSPMLEELSAAATSAGAVAED